MSSGGSLNAARWYTPNFVTCQALTLTHNGQGSDPIAAPTNSPGCPPGEYGAAESINLSRAAAAPGWQIAGWSGTEDDASTSSTNTVIMPSNAHTVTVNYELLPPAAPIPLAPAGSIFTTSVTYSWSSVFFAVDYQVLVIEDGTGPVHNQWYLAGDVCSGGACSVTPAAPLSLGAHTWYVKARNAVGSAQSPGTWFHVAAETVPAVPNLRQPAGTIADNQPGYRWDHVGGAVEYQLLVVGADSAQYFNTWYQAVDICNSTLCDVPQPSPLPEQGYAWYVRARNPYGSTWSPGKLFNVFSGVRPVAPTLLAPIGIISDTTPVYTWSDGGDAYDFMLLVVDSQRNREIHDWYLAADICNGTVCTVTQTVPLTNDNYIWYLKARNPAGATWAVGKRFTVFTGGPVGVATPIMPAGIISDTTPTYTWGEGSDAVDYQLLLFNSSGSLILNAWYLADDICSAGSCQATPVMVLSEADYSWQVKSRNPLGAVYSSRLYFTVDLGP